jgi:O-antigen ligase/tetratricopeptide (TPR) repeat protein
MARLGAWFALVLSGLAIFFTLGTYATVADVVARMAVHVLVLVVVLGFLLAVLRAPRWFIVDGVTAGAAVVAVIGFLSAAASSYPRVAFEGAIGIGAASAVFAILWSLMHDRWFQRRLSALLVVVPIAMLGVYLLHVMAAWVEWWAIVGRVTTPPLRPNLGGLWFGSPNVVAAVLILTVPQALARLPIREGRRRRLMIGALSIALAVAVVVTGSRGGLVALIVVGLLAGALWLRGRTLRTLPSRRTSGFGLAAVVTLVGLGAPMLVPRFLSIAGAEQRLSFWQASASMVSTSPITGVGPGVWPIAKLANNPEGAPNLVVPHAHATLIHTVAELGLLGFVALVLLLAITARLVWRASRDSQARIRVAGTAIGLAGFGVTSIVDHVLNLGSVFLLLALVVAGLAPQAGTRIAPIGSASVRVMALAISGLILFAASVVIRWDLAAIEAVRADRQADAGRVEEARATLLQAAVLDPDLPMLSLSLGLIDARLDRTEARAEVERATSDDGLAMHLISLARLRADIGDDAGALVSARVAFRRDPGDENVALNVGAIAEDAGDLALAVDAYAHAIALDPELAWSNYWRDPARQVAADDVVTAALALVDAGDPLKAVSISVFAGRTTSLVVAERDAPFVAALRELVERGAAEALPTFVALAERDPLDARPVLWCERLSRSLGDVEAATRYERWATALGAEPSAQAAKRGSVVELAETSRARPIPGNYPWALYGRAGPHQLVVPGVLVIDPRAVEAARTTGSWRTSRVA